MGGCCRVRIERVVKGGNGVEEVLAKMDVKKGGEEIKDASL